MIDETVVIDFHGQIGYYEWIGQKDDPELIVRTLDAAGIDKLCINNNFYPSGRPGNDHTARFVEMYPDRFIGFAYVSPMIQPDEMRAELARAFDELGFIGIKVYSNHFPWHYSALQYAPIYEFANERSAPLIFHTGVEPNSRPRFLAEIAPRFPNAYFVACHSGNTPEGRSEAIAAAQACPNVYLETSSTYRTPGTIEELVNGAGAERVLYGSDVATMDPRPQIGKIITADITDEAKRLVLGENALRLLRM